jgi:hypothetical protein
MVPNLSAETWDTPLVPELELETTTTESNTIIQLEREDAMLVLLTSFNAANMVETTPI